MNPQSYFYNCSPEYINSIDTDLHNQIITVINRLPKRLTQSEINSDLFWLLTSHGWNYDTVLKGTGDVNYEIRKDDQIAKTIENIKIYSINNS